MPSTSCRINPSQRDPKWGLMTPVDITFSTKNNIFVEKLWNIDFIKNTMKTIK